MLEDDAHITEELSNELGISIESVHTILNEKLLVTKVCFLWIPHSLSDEQKLCRVQFSQDVSQVWAGGNYRLSDIITGDEKWFNFFMQPDKEQNKV